MNKMGQAQQLNSLQAVRGLAAILVLLHHTTNLAVQKQGQQFFNGIFAPGNMGVDLFFVLSGFIIYYIHHKDIGKKDKYKAFLSKRFIRIYPTYWIVALILLPLYFIIPSIGESYSRNPWYLIKSFLLFPQSVHPIVGPGWTLTHEMFFYLIFSLLILIKPKYSKPIFISWLFISFCLFVSSFFFENSHYYLNFIFSSLNLEFAFGSLSAFLILRYNSKFKFLLYFGLISVIISWSIKIFTSVNIHEVISWGIPSALIIIGCVSYELDKNVKIPKIIKYFGDASYSIYLIHGFALLAGHYVFKYLDLYRYGSLSFLILAIFSLFCGCIFHSIIEKPFLAYLRFKIKSNPNTVAKKAS
jgi:exopolysaccharide production protein ExoZ